MALFARSNLKDWVPGTVGAVALVSLVAFAGYSQSHQQKTADVQPAVSATVAATKTVEAKAAAPAPASSPQASQPSPSAVSAKQATPAAAGTTEAKPPPAVNVAAPSPKPASAEKAHAHHPAVAQGAAPPSQPSPGVSPQTPAASTAVSDADVARGRQVYKKCQACHSLEPGKNGLGPTLAGIVNQKVAHVASYKYSPAMKASDLTWDAETLDRYLTDPQKVIPGNRMPFPGLKTENERRAVIAYLVANSTAAAGASAATPSPAPSPAVAAQAAPAASQAGTATQRDSTQPAATMSGYLPGIRYTLRTGIAEGRMVFVGVGGSIDGQINPLLSAAEGQVVQVTLINGEGAEHDIVFADQGAGGASPHIVGKGSSTNIAFVASKAGDYLYFCSIPGHRLAGMQGQFLVTPQPPEQAVVEADISLKSTDVPSPVGKREPQTVRVDLVTVELEGRLAEGTTFGYWTFNGKVPGPMLRVRVGDTVEVHMKNADGSAMVHSVDFHAATGPGGGAASTQADPGETKSFKFKALAPGLYVYHCATPMVAHHIANGMYGMILVEPEGGLPPVDREFYVMQGEIYTAAPFGQHGSQEFDVEKLLNERPEYFVFNGSVGALSKLHPLQAKVGETVRFYFGVGGPNFTSSFHLIGEIFDKVYNLGDVQSQPLRGVQTVTVPPGGAVITEVKLDVPGNYTLVDHALSRAERGLVGILHVEGAPNPEIYDGAVEPGSGH